MELREVRDETGRFKKDQITMLNVFQAAQKLLNSKDAKQLSFNEKLQLYFLDNGIMPLFIQDHYLTSFGYNSDSNSLRDVNIMAEMADCISYASLLDYVVHNQCEWSLMPNVGIIGCVGPSILNPRSYCSWAGFPTLMGKMSSLRKTYRMVREVKFETGTII